MLQPGCDGATWVDARQTTGEPWMKYPLAQRKSLVVLRLHHAETAPLKPPQKCLRGTERTALSALRQCVGEHAGIVAVRLEYVDAGARLQHARTLQDAALRLCPLERRLEGVRVEGQLHV